MQKVIHWNGSRIFNSSSALHPLPVYLRTLTNLDGPAIKCWFDLLAAQASKQRSKSDQKDDQFSVTDNGDLFATPLNHTP